MKARWPRQSGRFHHPLSTPSSLLPLWALEQRPNTGPWRRVESHKDVFARCLKFIGDFIVKEIFFFGPVLSGIKWALGNRFNLVTGIS